MLTKYFTGLAKTKKVFKVKRQKHLSFMSFQFYSLTLREMLRMFSDLNASHQGAIWKNFNWVLELKVDFASTSSLQE